MWQSAIVSTSGKMLLLLGIGGKPVVLSIGWVTFTRQAFHGPRKNPISSMGIAFMILHLINRENTIIGMTLQFFSNGMLQGMRGRRFCAVLRQRLMNELNFHS